MSQGARRGGALGLKINAPVFWPSASLAVLFVICTLLNLNRTTALFDVVLGVITEYAGWFFVLVVNVYLAVVLFFLFSRHGKIRLGGDDAKPQFTRPKFPV